MPLFSLDTLEHIRKTKFSWCFQGVSKEISGMKWVNQTEPTEVYLVVGGW